MILQNLGGFYKWPAGLTAPLQIEKNSGGFKGFVFKKINEDLQPIGYRRLTRLKPDEFGIAGQVEVNGLTYKVIDSYVLLKINGTLLKLGCFII
jgi:hypothetical protein